MSMIDYVTTATTKYIEQMPKAQRKKYGQFFTSKETAVFMAELFDLQSVSGPVSILDPGAGSGILSTAMIVVSDLGENIVIRYDFIFYLLCSVVTNPVQI